MRRTGFAIIMVSLIVGVAGCHILPDAAPQADGVPPFVGQPEGQTLANGQETNPVYVPWGPDFYGIVFEKVLQTLLDNEFELLETNRYDGRVETRPRVAPGLGLFWRPGTPTFYGRALASLQSIRHRVSVIVRPANQGGYFVEFIVRKELEDLPRPLSSTVGNAIFRQENSIERQYEVIDPSMFDSSWIYQGRDVPFEQALIADFLDALHSK